MDTSVKSTQTNPAALLVCVVYLYTVVQPGTDTVHFHRFLLCPICSTLYSIFDACWKCVLFSCDWNEWMFMYSIRTVVHLCCTQAWWRPGEADSSSTLIEDLKRCFQKKTQTESSCFSETCSIYFRSFCIIKTTLLYFEERTFVELFIPCSTIYYYCRGQCCSFVLNYWYLFAWYFEQICVHSLMDILHSCLHLALQLCRAGGAIVPHHGYFG